MAAAAILAAAPQIISGVKSVMGLFGGGSSAITTEKEQALARLAAGRIGGDLHLLAAELRAGAFLDKRITDWEEGGDGAEQRQFFRLLAAGVGAIDTTYGAHQGGADEALVAAKQFFAAVDPSLSQYIARSRPDTVGFTRAFLNLPISSYGRAAVQPGYATAPAFSTVAAPASSSAARVPVSGNVALNNGQVSGGVSFGQAAGVPMWVWLIVGAAFVVFYARHSK